MPPKKKRERTHPPSHPSVEQISQIRRPERPRPKSSSAPSRAKASRCGHVSKERFTFRVVCCFEFNTYIETGGVFVHFKPYPNHPLLHATSKTSDPPQKKKESGVWPKGRISTERIGLQNVGTLQNTHPHTCQGRIRKGLVEISGVPFSPLYISPEESDLKAGEEMAMLK